MKIFFTSTRRCLSKSILLAFSVCLCTANVIAQNITINNVGSSTGITVTTVSGVTTFSPASGSAATLDATDVENALVAGNAVVITTPTGNINVVSNNFFPDGGQLSVIAENGNIDFENGNSFTIPSTTLNIALTASGTVTTTNNGAKANDGTITINANTIVIGGQGLDTDGGDITLTSDGTTNVGTDGIDSGSGDVVINAGGDVTVTGAGIETIGGDITISGANVDIMQNGITTDNSGAVMVTATGDIMIDMSRATNGTSVTLAAGGNVSIMNTGMNVNGGDFRSSGISFMYTMAAALMTQGGDIVIDHSGDIVITGGGFRPGTGMVTIGACSASSYNVTVGGAGISTDNSDVLINAVDGSITVEGAGIQTGNGTGGTVTSTGTVNEQYAGVVSPGGGNIVLNTIGSQCLATMGIPTMGQWALFILMLLFSAVGLTYIYRHRALMV